MLKIRRKFEKCSVGERCLYFVNLVLHNRWKELGRKRLTTSIISRGWEWKSEMRDTQLRKFSKWTHKSIHKTDLPEASSKPSGSVLINWKLSLKSQVWPFFSSFLSFYPVLHPQKGQTCTPSQEGSETSVI